MLTLISSPPISISPEEHAQLTSSTPSSFVDIPPVLRWVDDVQVVLSSTQGGWEGWNQGKANGRLWVTEDSVAFIPAITSIPGFNLPFPSLILHALTPSNGDVPAHLYCQIDESDSLSNAITSAGPSNPTQIQTQAHTQIISDTKMNGSNGEDHQNIDVDNDDHEEDDDDDGEEGEEYDYQENDEYTEMREIRIFLNESKLEPLFQALSSCSALHDSLLPNGEPSSFFGFGGDDDAEGYDDGQGQDGQWEDADEDDEDGNGNANGAGRVRSDFHSGGGPQARFRPY
ncbi:uncharacterized protein IL334_001033 [Kwoniella shivajii]|uniref:Chloride channel, nucleotide-sensitive, 1A n=1 Tax=Kwoniella shivajii TaxID=564305 RepID=A0ABZ1CQT5_9TREE|nr:hypothetical protein IL334_001033 [Kwoniella shivajii]